MNRRPPAIAPAGPAARASRPWDLAAEAAEAVRAINHITADAGEGYQHPVDVDATLAELSLLASRLPQALAQARTSLNGRHAAGTLGHDTYPAHTTGTVAAVAG